MVGDSINRSRDTNASSARRFLADIVSFPPSALIVASGDVKLAAVRFVRSKPGVRPLVDAAKSRPGIARPAAEGPARGGSVDNPGIYGMDATGAGVSVGVRNGADFDSGFTVPPAATVAAALAAAGVQTL